ncbi:hypothetical protein Tco_0955194 [Tanacetum coccineum]|uniref:Reverse transcriptase domain-containing protein n=1 Tax=Tanacetum coccineum TaxID=301880 RepID=A0ABQ5E6L3_9ASTR
MEFSSVDLRFLGNAKDSMNPSNPQLFIERTDESATKTRFAPHRIPQSEGNHNGWLSEEEEANSDSESTAKNASRRATSEDENPPDIATLLAQQLQNLLPKIVNQVTANVNANAKQCKGNVANGGNGGNEKRQMQCWNDSKALLVEEFCPSNEMEKLENKFWNHKMIGANHAGLVDLEGNVKKAKRGTNFVVAAPSKEGYAGSQPWCAKCRTHHHEKANCRLNRESEQSENQLALGWCRNDRGGGNQVRERAYNASMNAAEAAKDSSVVTDKFEFRIELILGAMPVAKSPYRLAPPAMQELSEQMKELADKVIEAFEFYDMPFSDLTNALAIFMDLMNRVCKPYLDKFVIVFIDDILIYSKTKEDYKGKKNVVIDALRRKERVKPRRIRAMAMTIRYGVRGMMLAAQSEAFKQENGMMRTIVMDEAHASRSPVLWVEIGESSLIGPKLVQETTDKVVLIKEKLKAARDRQKSHANNRRKPLDFEVGDRVMLKVLPYKGVAGFGKKGKLAPSLHVPLDEIKVDKTLCFVEELVETSDREIKRLKCCRMVVVKAKWLAVRYLVKVSWNSKCNFELTWVWEDYLKDKYPRLIVWLVKPLVLTYESVVMYGLCVYMRYVDCVRVGNQSIERDRLIGIGLVMDLVKFLSFTFGGKEMTFVETLLPPKPDLSFSSFEEFTSEPIVIKPIVEKSEAKASEAKPKAVRCENSYFQDGSEFHNRNLQVILTNGVVLCSNLCDQGYAEDFYDQ